MNQGKANDSLVAADSCDSWSWDPPIRSRMRNISQQKHRLVASGAGSRVMACGAQHYPRIHGPTITKVWPSTLKQNFIQGSKIDIETTKTIQIKVFDLTKYCYDKIQGN